MAVTRSSEAGQLTARDIACLIWIATQYAIRFDQLQRLLYRYTPEQDRYKLRPGVDSLSLDRTYEIIRKWVAWELIEKKIILDGDKLWIWLSRKGLREVQAHHGILFSYGGQPSRLSHLYYINQVRLSIEAKRPNDLWKSERQILKESAAAIKGEEKPHTPDAILTNMTNGKVTAIEVECHAKTEDELADDLRELAVTYTSVWYFTTSATGRQVESMLETFPEEMAKPFVLYNLKDYGHEYKVS